MKISKIVCGAIASMMILTAPSYAAPVLTSEQISEAKVEGNHLVKNKKVKFAFFSSVKPDGHFLVGDERTEATAFWLTPYAHVVSEQINQGRDSKHKSFAALDEAGETYQLRVLFAIRNFQKDAFLNAEVKVMQVGKVLTPSKVRYAPQQKGNDYDILPTKPLEKIGLVLDFPADEVTVGEKVHVMITGDGGTPLVFELSNDGSYDDYETKSHGFKWTPLNDHL